MSVNADITKSASFSIANYEFQERVKLCHANAWPAVKLGR